MAIAEPVEAVPDRQAEGRESLERKPLLSFREILMMNVGFFGIQFSFGLQQTAVNPLFQFIGANPEDLPLLNLAGPMTGLLVQPIIGAMSDRTWSDRWGRRKPYFLIGAVGCSICLFLFPFVTALWMAVALLWALDASNNTAMEPYRAFISDKLPDSQLARGFLTQSMFVGAGAVTANFSLYLFQQLIDGTTAAGIPFWVFWAFFIGAFCSIASVLLSVLSTPEIPPTKEELVELRAKPGGFGSYIKDIADAVKAMPIGMHKIGLVFMFQWYAIVVYWQFVAVSIGESAFNAAPDDPGFEEAAGWVGVMNGSYNLVTIVASLVLIGIAAKFGAKWIHAVCLAGAAVAMFTLSQIGDQYVLILPMILLGVAWASMMGIPYIMVASMVPKERLGVYMGIVNMMIVVPMLIQTVTFGWIFTEVLDSKGTNAMIFSGILFACAAVAMLWVNPPKETEESEIMPLGSPKRMAAVYNRVVVGSDGTPASLMTVGHAAGVATAADADLVLVSAYNPDANRPEPTAASASEHQELYGEEAAKHAIRESIKELKKERARSIEHRIVAGTPAQALLEAAGSDPTNLIVVGNRGLGAASGESLGSIPREVVQHAVCNVMVVQTSEASDDDR